MENCVALFVAAAVLDCENVVVNLDVGGSLSREEKREWPERQPRPHWSPSPLALSHRACIYNTGSKNRAGGNLERSAPRNQFRYLDSFVADDQAHRSGVFQPIDPIKIANLYSGSLDPSRLGRAAERHAAPEACFRRCAIGTIAFFAVDGSHRS